MKVKIKGFWFNVKVRYDNDEPYLKGVKCGYCKGRRVSVYGDKDKNYWLGCYDCGNTTAIEEAVEVQ